MEILFKKGILAFEELRKFRLDDIDNDEIFKVLQSEEDKDIGLVVVSPYAIKEDYEIDIPDEVVKSLEIEKPKDVMLLTTVTLNSQISKTTTNLRAPIVINIKKNLGEQIILPNEKYRIKHPITERWGHVSYY